ncbi:MAG: sulfide/dihydroorotate dehydrogenase-like FAD/NAD-binding protein [Actinobacteria bacterium]|nr:sulfide/dihydroorotate dehydrogenase-like FAD/NAD-binding protein [Actinomycetota bacterium]
MYEIIYRRELTPITFLFRVKAPLVARKGKAGQFVIVRVHDRGERIPLTMADWDPEKGTVTIVVQAVGKTSRMLCAKREGEAILDLVGPLGRPAELPREGNVVLVGGGFGVAPIHPKAKALYEAGKVRVTSIIGARTRDLLILQEELGAVSHRLLVATDDGSYGKKGLVTDVLLDLVNAGEKIDEVVAIGPMVMMRAVAEATRPFKIRTMISADPIMVDGTGMCGACRMTVGGEVKFACVDGPVFDGHLVDFDEAVRRSRMYREEQKIALERYECEHCGGDR